MCGVRVGGELRDGLWAGVGGRTCMNVYGWGCDSQRYGDGDEAKGVGVWGEALCVVHLDKMGLKLPLAPFCSRDSMHPPCTPAFSRPSPPLSHTPLRPPPASALPPPLPTQVRTINELGQAAVQGANR